MQKFINVDPLEPGMVTEDYGLLDIEREEQITGGSHKEPLVYEQDVRGTSSTSVPPPSSLTKFEVSDRDSSVASSPAVPPSVSSASSTYSKNRDQKSKAMKEPKSVRK
jgi:hypothetical protein